MLKRQTSPQANKTPERRIDVRYVGPVGGCFSLSDRRDLSEEGSIVYACRTQSLSSLSVVVASEVVGNLGEAITAYFDGIGIIRGVIERQTPGGFAIEVDADTSTREKLAAKIEWLKLRSVRKLNNNRAFKRFQPKDPRSTIAQFDGTISKCFVLDLSRGGAGVCSNLRPKIGTQLLVGRVPSRVVRHLEVGFAVRFQDEQEIEGIEKLATGYALAEDAA